MRSGVIRELAANQELHRVLPASFKSERGTMNLYASVEDINNGQVTWRIDSSELTSDLMTSIEMKVAFRCRDIFGQVGSSGRYTQNKDTAPQLAAVSYWNIDQCTKRLRGLTQVQKADPDEPRTGSPPALLETSVSHVHRNHVEAYRVLARRMPKDGAL